MAIVFKCLMIGMCLALSGCAGLSKMQDSAAKFDQGVHSTGTAQMGLFHQVQAAECNRNFYAQGFLFATAARDPHTHAYPADASVLDLSPGSCTHTELTDAELAIRQKLIDALTLYADAIQAVANGASGTSMNDASKVEAADIKAMATQQKFSKPQATTASALNAAVLSLSSLIIDHAAYKHVRQAAAAIQGQLAIIVRELQTENTADAVGLQSKADELSNELRAALSAARDQSGAASFLEVVQARASITSVTVTAPDVVQLNASLDAIVKANDALAQGNEGAIPEISDLVNRSQRAATLFSAAR